MKEDAGTKILAVLSVLVGGAGTVLSLLVAFGVDITPDQHTAIVAAGSLLLLVVGAMLHPSVPIGPTSSDN